MRAKRPATFAQYVAGVAFALALLFMCAILALRR